MPDTAALNERLDAVERALTNGDYDLPELEESAELTAEVTELAQRIDSLEDRLTELEAAVQAVRGYAGEIRAVNEDVERRANAALAKVESFEEGEPQTPRQWDVEPVPAEEEQTEAQRSADGLVERVREVL